MIKKNLESVIKVLSLRANENVQMSVYDEDEYDIQVSFNSTSVPLVNDLRGILCCFFSNAYEIIRVEEFFGFTEIYLSDGKLSKGKVNTKVLQMFLPKDVLDKLK
jgi:hypothetical protein